MNKVALLLFLCFTGTHSLAQDTKSDSTEIFLIVDKSAEFPGGIGKFYKYLNANMKYPKDAKEQKVSGKVYVEFVINEDGVILKESVNVLPAEKVNKILPPSRDAVYDLTESCNNEAIRVIQNSPKWVPATIEEFPVKQKMVVPITFKL